MADAVMWIAWGPPVHGREERSLEVFGESVAYWGELQAEGRIERFDVALLNPYGDLNGFRCSTAPTSSSPNWLRTSAGSVRW